MSRTTFPPLEDDFTRALLRSAEGDEPSNAAYAKAAAALGVGASIGVGASLAAPSAVAAGAAGVARWSGLSAARLWALGVSGALLVGGSALLLHLRTPASQARGGVNSKPGVALHASAASAAAPVVALSPSITAPVAAPSIAPQAAAAQAASRAASASAEPSPSSVAATVAPSVAFVSSGEPRASSVARRPSALKPAASAFVSAFAQAQADAEAQASSGSSLAEQVQSLDRARVALNSGNPGSALAEISRYRKAWPHGVFLTEASVLEIEALAARGERSLAATRAASFVAAHPDSPQAERLRRLIPAEKP